jgi:signal transduction histidine kinase
MKDGNFSDQGRVPGYYQDVRNAARELIEADELATLLSTEIHFLAAIRNPLIALEQDIDFRFARKDILEPLLKRVYAEERRIRTSSHVSPQEALKQQQTLRGVIGPIDEIIKKVSEKHLVDPRIRECVELIEERIKYLRCLENDLMASASVDLGQVDLKAAIPSLVQFHRLGAGKSQIVFQTDVRTDKVVLIEPRFFNSILDNLLLNSTASVKRALAQSERKTGLIRTGAWETQTREGTFLEIEVEDNGLGIRQEEQSKLLARPSSGASMGLWTVSKIAQWYAGNVNIQSTFGRGTCVTVALNMGLLPEISREAAGSGPGTEVGR